MNTLQKLFKELHSFLILWSTQAFSALGSSMTGFALIIWSYQQEGSALTTAMLSVCSYAPYVVMSIFAGALSDKWNKKITAELAHSELLCGFVSGKAELQGWCRHDLFQLYYDTTNVMGNLGDMIEVPTQEDAKEAVLVGACNIYHGCSHNYLHAMDVDALTALYKAAFFVLQARHFCETGKYINCRVKPADCLAGDDLAILLLTDQLGAITTDNLSEATARLLHWSSTLICHNHDCGEL